MRRRREAWRPVAPTTPGRSLRSKKRKLELRRTSAQHRGHSVSVGARNLRAQTRAFRLTKHFVANNADTGSTRTEVTVIIIAHGQRRPSSTEGFHAFYATRWTAAALWTGTRYDGCWTVGQHARRHRVVVGPEDSRTSTRVHQPPQQRAHVARARRSTAASSHSAMSSSHGQGPGHWRTVRTNHRVEHPHSSPGDQVTDPRPRLSTELPFANSIIHRFSDTHCLPAEDNLHEWKIIERAKNIGTGNKSFGARSAGRASTPRPQYARRLRLASPLSRPLRVSSSAPAK